MNNGVLVVIGAGDMGQAIARRVGAGMTVLLADYSEDTLNAAAASMRDGGHRVEVHTVDVSDPASVVDLAQHASKLGPVTCVAHTAGLGPNQATVSQLLAVNMVGAALVLEAFGDIIAPGGAGVIISSLAGHVSPLLPDDQQRAIAETPARELHLLPFLGPESLTDASSAYGISKKANHIRVRAASLHWGRRGARINSISPGVIMTKMSRDELAGTFAGLRALAEESPTGRVGTAEDVAAVAAFLLSQDAAYVTGTDILVDGGVFPLMRKAAPAIAVNGN
jgi:NAD(P)-dependent dehydrogenase (short-subunit alcohol dehydrogenase family)